MIAAGMDAVRLNFSHGTYAQFAKIIRRVRKLGKAAGHEIAIIQDLQGPKIRTGDLPAEGIKVKTGENIILSTNAADANAQHVKFAQKRLAGARRIPVQYKNLTHDIKRKDTILIDDGLIELKVLSVNARCGLIRCKVIVGGVIKTCKGINVPTSSISASPLTAKDRKDLDFGIAHDVDFIALSFVKSAQDILKLQQLLRKKGSHAQIIAKLERHEAMHNMKEIIRAADAVMVARGDLGVEIPAEQVPLYQKKIIHLCNQYGKPVIVATQMLNSMIASPRATRAEISDAATAIFDHADGLMLSNETAIGKYPVAATKTLCRVASAVEKNLAKNPHLLRLWKSEDMRLTDAACLNATKLAQDIKARFIVVITKSGYTAREIAKYRPFIPLIVFTSGTKVARQMALLWGVKTSFIKSLSLRKFLPEIRKILLAHKLAKHGDEIVICNASRKGKEKLITTAVV